MTTIQAGGSNARQMGLGLRMYVEDGGVYPGVGSTTYAPPWYTLLEPHVGSTWPDTISTNGQPTGLFACPGYNRISGKYRRSDGDYAGGGSGAYGYNFSETFWGIPDHDCRGLGGFTGSESGRGRPLKDTQVARPSDMIAITDSILWGSAPTYSTVSPGYLFASYNGFSDPFFAGRSDTKELDAGRRVVARRHNDRFTTLFCDGHVEAIKTDLLFNPLKPEVRRRWHFDNKP